MQRNVIIELRQVRTDFLKKCFDNIRDTMEAFLRISKDKNSCNESN